MHEVTSNNHYRDNISYDDMEERDYIKYKGEKYYLDEFIPIKDEYLIEKGWNGVVSQTIGTGIVIGYDNTGRYKVGFLLIKD